MNNTNVFTNTFSFMPNSRVFNAIYTLYYFPCGSECACILFNSEAIQYELPTEYAVLG